MNDEMLAREVPNWMLYDLMRDMRDDIAKLDTKLSAVESRLDIKIDAVESKLEAKIDAVDARLTSVASRLETKIDKNTERIEDLFLRQDKVKVSFSRTFAIANAVFSGLVAYVTVLFTGEYQTS